MNLYNRQLGSAVLKSPTRPFCSPARPFLLCSTRPPLETFLVTFFMYGIIKDKYPPRVHRPLPNQFCTFNSIYLLLFRVRLVKTLCGPSAAARTG